LFILTQPVQVSNTITGVPNEGIILASTTDVIDVADNTNNTIKWIVELKDQINLKIHSYEILATNIFNTDIKFNKYGTSTGPRINHSIDVQLNGSNIELIIINNETVNIDYKIARIQLN